MSDLAGEFGYSDGSGIRRVVQRLEARTKREKDQTGKGPCGKRTLRPSSPGCGERSLDDEIWGSVMSRVESRIDLENVPLPGPAGVTKQVFAPGRCTMIAAPECAGNQAPNALTKGMTAKKRKSGGSQGFAGSATIPGNHCEPIWGWWDGNAGGVASR
jgi:hypothetical protein